MKLNKLNTRVIYTTPVYKVQEIAKTTINRELTNSEIKQVALSFDDWPMIQASIKRIAALKSLRERNKDAKSNKVHYAVCQKVSILNDDSYQKVFAAISEKDARSFVDLMKENKENYYKFKITKINKGSESETATIE